MPELPEVETIVRGLRTRLPHRKVLRTHLRHRSLYRRGSLTLRWLVDRTVGAVDRVGKNAVIRFDPAGLMVVNLGMTGRLVASASTRKPAGNDAKHLHARMLLEGGLELRYYDARRFGRFYVAEKCDFARDLNIGPDPFLAKPQYLTNVLLARKAPIKALLLDQRIISGIGNIYADETLFYAGVDPSTPGRVAGTQARAILSNARSVLRRAIKHGGSTLRDYRRHDGSRGGFQRFHAVYGREGQPCFRCGAIVEKLFIAGRGTHFCRVCQR
ncbi:MAG: bifunctional DNA-formamidopyrimidine glycosylase/DNA-(apurinic or apyrimidinic site) lyase [Candidatus Krumholzibacteria bacterium]|nr:bifunctional DNA-formamidopyrimidine glycosylase/DNA-(apurinic or apyrimidinic site) lyase [Candidatus Krumholzibacteria bacterium]